MTDSLDDADQHAKSLSLDLIERGSEFSGAMAGAAIGLIGGPPGALAGAAAGVALTHTFRWVGSELRQRMPGPREEVRVGGAYAMALARINERIKTGETPRDDFVIENHGRRSVAEELLEGTLLMAARSYEERKIPLLGRMYASLAMTRGITTGYAHFLLRLADRLTYRQLVMLSIVGSKPRERLAQLDELVAESITGSVFGFTEELDELGTVGCLGIEGGKIGVGSLAEMSQLQLQRHPALRTRAPNEWPHALRPDGVATGSGPGPGYGACRMGAARQSLASGNSLVIPVPK